ncbi:MAG: universal stress protein [Dehalococcoidia bacterium]|nr:universal stress protein [Dehalococcoidia bacterium]MCA9849269.1 universal stress protein [Dehalococcoidia bacterium]
MDSSSSSGRGDTHRVGYRRILVPTDGSPLAEAAYVHARAISAEHRADVVILRSVVPRANRLALGGAVAMAPGAVQLLATLNADVEAELEVARANVREVRDAFESRGVRCAPPRVVEGVPGEVIIRVARDLRCDLIVMSTHGRSGLGRLVLGSVAQYVVAHLEDPALLLCRPAHHGQP